MIDRPELADDPRFRTNKDRIAHYDDAPAWLGDALKTRTRSEWVRD